MIYLFLANGFEEVEALTPLDMLRRANLPVTTVGIGTDFPCGAHSIRVKADIIDENVDFDTMTGMILPGGMPGTINLEKSAVVQKALVYAIENHLPVAAICAAPSILGQAGYLIGRRATCFPEFEGTLFGATLSDNSVVVDDNIITAKGAGVALEFALALVTQYSSSKIADELRGAIQCQ